MKQKVWTGIPIAVWILQITAELFAVYSILKLNMLPMNWMAAVLFLALFVFAALTAALVFLPKQSSRRVTPRQIIAIILALAITCGCTAASSALSRLSKTVSTITNGANQVEMPEVTPNITNTPILIYLSGSDTRDQMLTTSRNDVNILAVVNPNTKQILLINTPRDYYIGNPAGGGAKDKLTHCGIYGIDCSMEALAGLYQEEINYYAQINFTGFKTLIDAIGGVTVYSDTAFKAINTEIHVGNNDLDGAGALDFARARHALSGGDNDRGKHQMGVIRAVVQKLSAGTILTHYAEIMDSLAGMFITDMSSGDVSSLVRMQLSDLAKWDVFTYAVTGTGGRAETYSMPGWSLYVMYPNEETVAHATELIDKMVDGETLTENDIG